MGKIRTFTAFLMAAVLLGGIAGSAHAVPTGDERTAELKMLQLVNNEREARGLDPLVEDDPIVKEARKHSTQMMNQGFLEHDGQDERFARIAAEDSGTDVDKMCELVGSAGITNPKAAAKAIFHAWEHHPAFARCMFDGKPWGSAESVGVGVQFSGFRFYFTFIAANDTTP